MVRRLEPAAPYSPDDFVDEPAEGHQPRPPIRPSAPPAWSWRTVLVTVLHVVGGWVRHRVPSPVSGGATDQGGSAALLLD